MTFQTVEQLQAEIERLRALATDAYREGFNHAADNERDMRHGRWDLGFNYYWERSKARAALQHKEDAA